MTADHPTREEQYAAARDAAVLYNETHAEVIAAPIGSTLRRLHTALGDLAHAAALVAADPAPEAVDAETVTSNITDQSGDSLLARRTGQGGADRVPRRTAQTTDLMVPAAPPSQAPAQPDAALSDEVREALAAKIAVDLERRGFMGWLLSNGNSPLWADSTPEQEIGRVAASAALELLAARAAQPVPAPEVSRGVAEVLEAAVMSLCNEATTSANEFGKRSFVLDVDEFRATVTAVVGPAFDERTHGGNHAPLSNDLLDPGYCDGCDKIRADRLVRDALGGERGDGA